MTRQRKDLGDWGENEAAEYLVNKNYRIIGQKVRTRIGEIDILAQDGMTLVVVMVKAKADASRGTPEEMVDWKKQRKLIRLAKEVNQNFPAFGVRIDVIAIEGREVRHHVSAVEDNRY